jgi:ABC-type transporter Mla MlaB component
MDVPTSHPHDPTTGLFVIAGPIGDGDTPRLCERLQIIISCSDGELIFCDVGALPANVRTIEALARLQLTARRHGRRIRLQRASRELQQLIEFVGLSEVLAARPALRGRRSGHAEEREHPRGVEEGVDRDDPPV